MTGAVVLTGCPCQADRTATLLNLSVILTEMSSEPCNANGSKVKLTELAYWLQVRELVWTCLCPDEAKGHNRIAFESTSRVDSNVFRLTVRVCV